LLSSLRKQLKKLFRCPQGLNREVRCKASAVPPL
jgi:hypothetical protein